MEAAVRQRFIADYTKIRHAEGRGSEDPAYYLELPYRDLSGRNAAQWEIRGRTYRHFERTVLREVEREQQRPLDILDLGAGNCWMSHRLALRRHRAVALDIFTDPRDGLGARHHYPTKFAAVEAEFDFLPFHQASFDIVIFNSSIHYSTDYRRTLLEAKRCLRPGGRVVIMDSPVYRRFEHGEKMLRERHEFFERQYGFRSDAVPSIEFFDEAMLAGLARDLAVDWRRLRLWYGWRWALRPWKARIQRRRPPSRFFILVGRFRQ
jgi:SAM-dependent methyltransferase